NGAEKLADQGPVPRSAGEPIEDAEEVFEETVPSSGRPRSARHQRLGHVRAEDQQVLDDLRVLARELGDAGKDVLYASVPQGLEQEVREVGWIVAGVRV